MDSEMAHYMRVAKRVSAATGYLELGMTDHALNCLDSVTKPGPFEAEIAWLRGHALRLQHRYADAAIALKTAAEKFPSPQDKSAWLALSHCYHQAGNEKKAVQMLAQARGSKSPRS